MRCHDTDYTAAASVQTSSNDAKDYVFTCEYTSNSGMCRSVHPRSFLLALLLLLEGHLLLIHLPKSCKCGSRVCIDFSSLFILLIISTIANYDSAMKAVAFMELVILLRVLVGAITFQNSLLSPILYVHFLRQRWYQSQFTRDAVAYSTGRIEATIAGQQNPTLMRIWGQGKSLVQRWGGSNVAPAPPPTPR